MPEVAQSLISQSRSREETEPPGKERKHHKTETDSTTTMLDEMRAMRAMLMKDHAKRDEQHQELTGSFADLKNQVKLVSKSVDNERATRET